MERFQISVLWLRFMMIHIASYLRAETSECWEFLLDKWLQLLSKLLLIEFLLIN